MHLRGALVLWAFMLIWLGAGAAAGFLIDRRSGPPVGVVGAAILAVGCLVYALSLGDQLILSTAEARAIQPGEEPELRRLAEALAATARVPVPALYLIDDPSPNAFATGRSRGHAAIAVTSGLLKVMNEAELEGVLAHEMSHIRNADVRLLLIVSTGIGLLGLLASLALQSLAAMPRRDDQDERAGAIVLGIGLLLGMISWLVGPLMQLALSRSRESLADAAGVALVGSPSGLLSALDKLRQNRLAVRNLNHVTAAMYIDNPLGRGHWFAHLFDTHPPIEARIVALERISGLPESVIEADEVTGRRLATAVRSEGSPSEHTEVSREETSSSWDSLGQIGGVILGLASIAAFFLWPGIFWPIFAGMMLFFCGYALGYHFARMSAQLIRTAIGLAVGTLLVATELALVLTGLWVWGLVATASVVVIVVLVSGLINRRQMVRQVDRARIIRWRE